MNASLFDCALGEPMSYSYFTLIFRGREMGRVKVNLTLDADVAESARSLGLNMSRLAEAAIVEASKAERNRLWREQNAGNIASYAKEIEREGLALSEYRTF